MGNGISDADRADVERLAVLNSHKATMLVGAPWKKLLRRHGFANEHEYLALMSQVVRRFAAEPALAEAFAQRNEAETAARMREAAVAKGLDPDAPGLQWHDVLRIDDKTARAFRRANEKLAAEPGPNERAAFDAWKRSCAEAAPVDPEPLVALGALLTRKDASGLEEELRLAAAEPSAYFRGYRRRLARRGVTTSNGGNRPHLAWLALVDGLLARKQGVELDWREAPEDAMVLLRKTRTELLRKGDFAFEDEVAELSTEDFLRAAAERFARAGVRLVVLDIASDSFPLAFHAVSDDAKVNELAERCARAGFGTLRWA